MSAKDLLVRASLDLRDPSQCGRYQQVEQNPNSESLIETSWTPVQAASPIYSPKSTSRTEAYTIDATAYEGAVTQADFINRLDKKCAHGGTCRRQ